MPHNQKMLSQRAISAPHYRIWWVGWVRIYLWRIFILQWWNLKKNFYKGQNQKWSILQEG